MLVAPLLVTTAWAGWFFLIPRTFSDEEPLPTGKVQAPVMLGGQDSSELRVFIRFSIDAFSRIVNELLPTKVAIVKGDVRGDLTRSTIAISSASKSRLRLDGSVTFNGTAPYGPFTLTKAGADISGTTLGLDFGPDWSWLADPDAKANVTEIIVKRAPDPVVRLVANSFTSWWLPELLPRNPNLSLRPVAETAWLAANRDIAVQTAPLTSFLVLRPKAAVGSEARIDEQRREISLCVGVNFESAITVGATPGIAESPLPTPLPRLDATRPIPSVSRVRTPVMLRVSDLSRFWIPQRIASPLGQLLIETVELSEQDGLLHGRMNFTLRPLRTVSLGTEQLRGLIRFQFRPICNPRIGQIRITDFTFTERSESLLIDMVGDGANAILRDAFVEAIPVLSDAALRRIEMELKAQTDSLLANAVSAWASAMPRLSQEIRNIKPSVSGISIKPIRVEAVNGYLLIALEGEAMVTLALD